MREYTIDKDIIDSCFKIKQHILNPQFGLENVDYKFKLEKLMHKLIDL